MTAGGPADTSAVRPPPDPTVYPGHLRSVARGGLVNVVGGVGNGVLQLVLVLVVTNLFAVRDAGTFFTLTSLFVVIAAAASLGADAGLARLVPQHLHAQRPDLVSALVRVAGAPVVAVACVLAVTGVVVGLAAGPSLLGDAPGSTAFLLSLCLVLPAAAVLDLAVAATRTLGTMVPSVVVDKLGRAGLQVAAVAAVGVLGGGAVELGLAWSLPFLVAAPAAVLVLRRRGRRALARVGEPRRAAGPAERRSAARAFWAFTWPRGVARFLQIALVRIDVVLVAALAGPSEAAVYAAASRLLLVGSVGVGAIQQALQPHLGRAAASGDDSRMIAMFRQATAWNVAFSWPIFLLLAAAAPVLTDLLGEGYEEAATPLTVLALAMLFATFSGPVDMVVLMSGRSRWSMVNAAVALVTDVALLMVLVPRFGITGAAWAWAAAIVVRNVLPLLQVRMLLGAWPTSRAGLAAGAAAVLLVGVPLAVIGPATGHAVLPSALAAVVGGSVYLGALWWLRGALHLAAFRGMLARGRRTSPDNGTATPS